MELELKINTNDQQDVEHAYKIVTALRVEKKPIDKKIEAVAEEKQLDPTIIAKGLEAVMSNGVTLTESPEPPTQLNPNLTVTANDMPVKAVVKESSIDVEFEAPQTGVEVDSAGFPWDHRIHSSSKKKTVKDGRWKYMRGLDEATKNTVEAELKKLMSISAPTITPVAPTVQPPSDVNETPVPPVAQPQEPASDMTFPEFMTAVTEAGLDEVEIQKACNSQGVESLFMLASRPDLIPAVYSEIFI